MDSPPPPLPPNRPPRRGGPPTLPPPRPRGDARPPPYVNHTPTARQGSVPSGYISPQHRATSPRPLSVHSSDSVSDVPPPIPTSARPRLSKSASSPVPENRLSMSGSMNLFPSPNEKFTLTQLVDNYSGLFPIKIRVVKGFYGDMGEEGAIAVDELYNFHFVKRSMVVSISDVAGNKYKVPLNSATKFGIIYGNGEPKTFNTVDEIMNANPLPKVVCAEASYVGNNEASSVHRHEILAVKEVDKGGRFRFRSSMLKMFSITKNMDKSLAKDVFGKFSTDPFNTQMFLPEFIKHLKDPIPSKVRLFPDFECDEPLPEFLISEDISLGRIYVETSIIASPLTENDSEQDSEEITEDIPISLDIEVSVIPPDDEDDDDYEKLTEDTVNLLTHFDPSSANHRVDTTTDSDYSYTNVQNQFFKAVRKGFETEGLKIETPRKIRSYTMKKDGVPSNEGDMDDYEDVNIGNSPLNSPQHTSFNTRFLDNRPPIATPPNPSSMPSNPLLLPPLPPAPPKRYPAPLSDPPPLPPSHPTSAGAAEPPSLKQLSTPPTHPADSLPPRTKPRPASARSHGMDISSPPAPKNAKLKRATSSESTGIISSTLTESPDFYSSIPDQDLPNSIPPNTVATPPKSSLPPNPGAQKPPPFTTFKRKGQIPSLSSTEEEPVFSPAPKLEGGDSSALLMQSSVLSLIKRVEKLEREGGDQVTAVSRSELSAINAQLESLSQQVEETASLSERLEGEIKKLKEELRNLNEQMKEMSSQLGNGSGPGPATITNADLEGLDNTQVLKLLELMGLSKYRKTFEEVGIDGSILMQCNDQILKEELSMKSGIDRIRILQVISGRRPIQSIFQKSYVTFEPCP